ncbi:MAG TPA: hypothetical protein VFE46_09165 [Pirellulales bacterium]|nr:hypothetical protein [Pirellulales bacterium]
MAAVPTPEIEPNLPASAADSNSFEDQIIADALAEDAFHEDQVDEPRATAASPEEIIDNTATSDWSSAAPILEDASPEVKTEWEQEIPEAELLPPVDKTRWPAKKNSSQFFPAADEAVSEIEAEPKNLGDWLRSRPKWFWVVVAIGWVVAAAALLLIHQMPQSRSVEEWERARQFYLEKTQGKGAAGDDKKADSSTAHANEGAKTPAASSSK